MNFSESMVGGLTFHFYQKHMANSEIYSKSYIHLLMYATVTTEQLTLFCVQIAYVAKFAIYGVIFLH